MNLSDRGGGDRPFVERCEQAPQWTAEFGLDQGARRSAGKRRQAVLQARQIEGDFLAEDIGSSGQQLAELDKARPQFVERGGEPLTGARPERAAATRKQPAEAQQWRGTGDGLQRKERVVPCQCQADPHQARKIAQAVKDPEIGSQQVRDARPNGAQRRPPSGSGT